MCPIGELSLIVMRWEESAKDLKPSICLSNGTKTLVMDRVNLGSEKSRIKFQEKCPESNRKEIEDVLLELCSFLRTESAKKKAQQEAKVSQDEQKTEYTACFDGLVEIVDDGGKPSFLIKEDGTPKAINEIEISGKIFKPPPKDQIKWLLPRLDEVLKYHELSKKCNSQEYDKALLEDLINYHKNISELPNSKYYLLLALFDMHTYMLESFQCSPIIIFYAVPERGKSRTGKGIIYVSYRGLHVESLREAYILRVSENFVATLFFDVRDIWKKAVNNNSDDILLHRFEKGATVPRVLWPEKGPHQDTKFYNIFGPTIISTNEDINHILGTRGVSITMAETSKKFEKDVRPESALPLKERLVEFRLRHLGNSLLEAPKPARGRLGDILKPLRQIIQLVYPAREDSFMDLVGDIEKNRQDEKSETLDGQIIKIVSQLSNSLEAGYLAVKSITDEINQGKSENRKLSSQRIGRRLKALGFENGSTGDGGSAIRYDETKIERLSASYGIK